MKRSVPRRDFLQSSEAEQRLDLDADEDNQVEFIKQSHGGGYLCLRALGCLDFLFAISVIF